MKILEDQLALLNLKNDEETIRKLSGNFSLFIFYILTMSQMKSIYGNKSMKHWLNYMHN